MTLSAEELTGSAAVGEAFRPFIVTGGVTDTGLVALGPVGIGVAGAAVPGYGAWSPGSIVQCRGRIGGFAGDVADRAANRLGDAADWADGHLSEVGDDAGATVGSTPLFGRR
jgi:hypothetical protein